MKFECAAQDILYGLINATRALSARPSVPILDGVLMNVEENQVALTCSDGTFSVRTIVKASIEEEGDVVLPGKLLTEIIRKLPEGTVQFSMNDKLSVTVRCRQIRATITGTVSTEFPRITEIKGENEYCFSQKQLRGMIGKVSFAIAQQDTRQTLTGCLMELTPSELRMVGLDGFRLALQRLSGAYRLPAGKEQLRAIIPGKVIGEMARIMDDDEGEVLFHIDGTHLMAVIGDTTLVTSLIAGEYINYQQILPTAWLTRVTVRTQELLDSVERASLIAKEGKNNLIKMRVGDDQIVITSMSELGDVTEALDAHIEGEEIDIAFNARYISDVIKNIDEESCTLCMNTNVSPCVIAPLDGDRYLYLVLPVRTYN